MNWQKSFLSILVVALIGGCATMPAGPTVRVMPCSGKPFEVFAEEDYICRQWAQQQIGGLSPSETANQNLVNGSILGTLFGAGVGVAIGAATGGAGAGAAIGAGAGLLMGTSIASGPASTSWWELQQRYDITYQQCMYANGNQIPGVVRRRTQTYVPPPPPPGARIPNRAN